MPTILLLFGIALEIAFLLQMSRNVSRGPRFLFTILSVFWFLSFIMRPLIFLYSRNNGFDSSIYDSRIGPNEKILNEILFSIFLGCLIFCISIFMLSTKTRNVQIHQVKIVQDHYYSPLIYFGFACGYAAILIESTQLRNPFSKSLTILVTTIFCTYLWKRIELGFSNKKNALIFLCGAVGTYLLSVSANNSKGVLLLPVIVFLSSLTIWKRERIRGIRLFLIALATVISIQLFSILQRNKLGGVSVNASNRNADELPWFLSPFLILVNRFDQFARVTDVYFAGVNPLGSYRSWFTRLLVNLQWNPGQGRTAISFGQEWNQLVTNQSVPGARLSKVSLGQGMIAEGLIWSGFISLIIQCIAISVIFIWIGRLLERGPLSIVFAFGLIANGSVFEMGLVQFSQILSGSAKMLAFIWVAKVFYKFMRNDKSKRI